MRARAAWAASRQTFYKWRRQAGALCCIISFVTWRARKTISLFSFTCLIFCQFAPVIVVSPAYGIESIGVIVEGIAKSREVLVPKNISITYVSVSEDGRPLMTSPIIRQAGCYLVDWFRLGRAAGTDDIAFEKVSLQWWERAWARHPLASDTRKVYLSDNSGGPPIIVEHVANMFGIFDTLRRSNSDDSLSICGGYNNKNEWSLRPVESLFGDTGGFRGGICRLFSGIRLYYSNNDKTSCNENQREIVERNRIWKDFLEERLVFSGIGTRRHRAAYICGSFCGTCRQRRA